MHDQMCLKTLIHFDNTIIFNFKQYNILEYKKYVGS